MHNFKRRIRLANGKWAYEQHDEFSNRARIQLARIERLWTPPPYFFHFQPGGHVAAVRSHTRNFFFGKVDLQDFFQNVTRQRIIRRLKAIGYSFQDAQDLAIASTVREHSQVKSYTLPLGFVQSPHLASLALDGSALGRYLAETCRKVTLTVYMDDIIVSSSIKEQISSVMRAIQDVSIISKFPLNKAKTQGPVESIRVFNIEFRNDHMEIATDRFEEMQNEINTNGPGVVSDGIFNYVCAINADQATSLCEKFAYLKRRTG